MSSIEKAIEKAGKRQKETAVADSAIDAAVESSREVEDAVTTVGRSRRTASEAARESAPTVIGRSSGKPMAKVDVGRMRALGMLTPDGSESALAEEFRRIKRPLLNNAFGASASLVESGNLIMVTSAIPNEGKTFVSLSLAVSIAMELDKTVLLVDTDVMKETATKLFHTEAEIGLIDAILDTNVSLGDVIVPTDVPKLGLLPAGRLRGKATELLASDKMRHIAQELATRYDDRVVLFDSPPLLATTEAGVLASLVGQIVMVVESEKTTQRQMTDALAMLDEGKPIGLLLNKSKTAGGSGYYYGYYGYK